MNTLENERGNMHASVRTLTIMGVMTAVICILAPVALPIGPVPISLSTFVLYLALYILGTKRTCICCGIYLLIGMAGVPVFAGFSGGVGKLLGPTGGYLIGYLPMILIAGILIDRAVGRKAVEFLAMAAGILVCYLFGTCWLSYQAHMSFQAALFAGVIPFIAGDIIKMILVLIIGPATKIRLSRAHLI